MTMIRIRDALSAHPPRLVARTRRRRAAVALILDDDPAGIKMLFIERAECEGDPWSGHLGFPGGGVNPEDMDIRSTAERETMEEIGLDLRSAEHLGRLDDVRSRSLPVLVSCIVYALRGRHPLVLNGEVREAFWAPLDALSDPQRRGVCRIQFLGVSRTVPVIDLLGPNRPFLWGITRAFLANFLRISGMSGEIS